jgi:hypothetical protein
MAREDQQFMGAISLEEWSAGVTEYCENLQIPCRLVTPFSDTPLLPCPIIPTLLGLSIPSIKRQGALHSKGEVSIGVGRTKFTVDRQG